MRIISKKRIKVAGTEHPEWEPSLEAWYKITKKANWQHFLDIRKTFNTVDRVGECVIFDVGGNKCRLISWVNYRGKKVFIRKILNHADYDKGGWKNECDCD